jgi:hypothetical protein
MSRDLIRIILLFILLLSQGGHAVAPEVDLEEMEARRRANGVNPNMQNLQILMKENQINLEFLNVAISNMISPKVENKKIALFFSKYILFIYPVDRYMCLNV